MSGINILEGTVNPLQVSKISKLQDFYGLSFEELFDVPAMKKKGVKDDEITYIKENREIEFSKKSTIGYELRKGVLNSDAFKKLQDFYGITLEDTQDVAILKKKGVSDEDIKFIVGEDVENIKVAEVLGEDMNDLIEKHKIKFGKYPAKNIKIETLIKKLGV